MFSAAANQTGNLWTSYRVTSFATQVAGCTSLIVFNWGRRSSHCLLTSTGCAAAAHPLPSVYSPLRFIYLILFFFTLALGLNYTPPKLPVCYVIFSSDITRHSTSGHVPLIEAASVWVCFSVFRRHEAKGRNRVCGELATSGGSSHQR